MKLKIENMGKKKFGQKILYSPFVKIIIGIIVCVGVVLLGETLIPILLELTGIEQMKPLIVGIFIAVFVIISYSVLYKAFEKRKITEFSRKGIGKNFIVGVMLGVILQSLIISVIYLKGSYTVISVNPIVFTFLFLVMSYFAVAIFEETLFRGIIFRITEEKLGSYLALLISSLIFGAMHLFNPNSSLIAGVGLTIIGFLFASAYTLIR